jgi:hypothetical protein
VYCLGEADFQRLDLEADLLELLSEPSFQLEDFLLRPASQLGDLLAEPPFGLFALLFEPQLAFADLHLGGSVVELGEAGLELIEGLRDQARTGLVLFGLGQLLLKS